MNPLADLPPWIAVLVALFAGGVLIVLNLGWLMAAKSMLDGQRKKGAERPAGTSAPPTSAAATSSADPSIEGRGPTGRAPIV